MRINELEASKEEHIQAALTEQAKIHKHAVAKAMHDALLEAFKGPDRYVVYFGLIRVMEDGRLLIKIGSSKNIKTRCTELINTFGSMCLFKVVDCPMNEKFERFLQQHHMIKPCAFYDEIHNGHRSNTEVFLMSQDQIDRVLRICAVNIHKFVTDAEAAVQLNIELAKAQKYEAKLQLLRQMGSGPSSHKAPSTASSTSGVSDLEDYEADPMMLVDARRYTQARGPKIQRYSSDGAILIKTYAGMSDAMRDPEVSDPSRSRLKVALACKETYKGFRWAPLVRSLPDDTVQAIGPTVEPVVAKPKKGLVAMLNLQNTEVVKVFCDAKAGAADRNFKGGAPISKALKEGTQSGGHRFKMWADVDAALQDAYLAGGGVLPDKRVASGSREVEQLHPTDPHLVIKRFASVEDVQKALRISRNNLYAAAKCGIVAKGYRWRFVEGT